MEELLEGTCQSRAEEYEVLTGMLRDGGGGVGPCEVLKGVTTGLRGVAGRRRKGALTDWS